jgi:hypothetical protein
LGDPVLICDQPPRCGATRAFTPHLPGCLKLAQERSHHGCPQRRKLMEGDGRDWLEAQPLPETAREQITVALAMIDALERQIAPLDAQLRPCARRQTGCRALIDAY